MPHTPPTLTEGLPLDVWISFSKAVCAFLVISPECLFLQKQHQPLVILPVEGKCWGTAVGMAMSANCFLDAKYPCKFTMKDEYGGTPLLQKVKKIIIFLQWCNYSHPRMWERQCLQAEGKNSAFYITGNRTDKPFSQQKIVVVFPIQSWDSEVWLSHCCLSPGWDKLDHPEKLQLPLQPKVTGTQAVVTL